MLKHWNILASRLCRLEKVLELARNSSVEFHKSGETVFSICTYCCLFVRCLKKIVREKRKGQSEGNRCYWKIELNSELHTKSFQFYGGLAHTV